MCVLFEQDKLSYVESLKAIREQALDETYSKEHLDDALDFIDNLELERLRGRKDVS